MATHFANHGSKWTGQHRPAENSASLIDYNTSRRQMNLFTKNRLGTASPPSPYTGTTEASWDESTPPPYDIAVGRADLKYSPRTGPRSKADMESQVSMHAQHYPTRERPPKQSSPRSFRGQITKSTSRSYSRPFRPGISVNTNVTRHKGHTPEQVFPSTSYSPRDDCSQDYTGSTAGALEERKDEPEASWIRKVSSPKKTRGSRSVRKYATEQRSTAGSSPGRKPSLPRHVTDNRNIIDDITPSDRAIPIGYMSSPDASNKLPSTPAISITPAQDNSGWAIPQQSSAYKAPRPRPTSSIYSQAAWKSPVMAYHSGAPPIPALPPSAGNFGKPNVRHGQNAVVAPSNSRDSACTTFEEQEDDTKYQRHTMSAETQFEEDQTPSPEDAAGKRYATRRKELAIDTTVPTPRRSKGWWNIITTPFENSRPGSRLFRTPTSAGEHTPEVPELPQAAYGGVYNKVQKEPQNDAQGQIYPADPNQINSSNEREHQTRGDQWYPNEMKADADRQQPLHLHIHLPLSNLEENASFHKRHDSQNDSKSGSNHGLGMVVHHHSSSNPQTSVNRGSISSALDRDVPLVLDSGMAAIPIQDEEQISSADSASRVASPFSGHTETPVLEVASLGTVQAPRTVDNTPSTSHQSSFRKNAPLPLNALPTRLPDPVFQKPIIQPPYIPHHEYQERLASNNVAAQSPPMTSFPAPMRLDQKKSSRFARPPEVNVYSVWEKDERLPHVDQGRRKKRRGCCGSKKQESNIAKRDDDSKNKKKTRHCLFLICIAILVLVALITALAIVLSRRRGGTKSSSPTEESEVQWLNLTGYPPMPTGQMKVTRPKLLAKVDGCANPTTLWSCDLPREAQQANLPGAKDEPSFKLEIRFSNDTVANGKMTRPLRFARDLGGSAFDPSPSIPNEDEQVFLGNSTDGNLEPFQGEDTPFFMSILSTAEESPPKVKSKREITVTRTTTTGAATSTANLASVIPSLSALDDGTAAPANLLPSPLPRSQPLKLYNRGTDKEHYGFYTYFDRSIFLKSVSVNNVSEINPGQLPADRNGGSTKDGAAARCTWTETRFLVQIWTRANEPLLSAATDGSSSDSADKSASAGNFPYPITITTDRHGGTPTGKMIYCYALDHDARPAPLNKTLMFENREFDGTLINGGSGPFDDLVIDPAEGGPGGMDGGTGGCGCRWGNWKDSNVL